MNYVVKYHPQVKKDISKLSSIVKGKIKISIEIKLMSEPDKFGIPLRKNLKGYWKLRIGNYRVVFKTISNEIFILGIKHRKDIYKIIGARDR